MKNKRAIVSNFGAPEVITMITEDIPRPRRCEVLIKVDVAGIAFADMMMRKGIYPGGPTPPFTPGYDIVGIIKEVGEGVNSLKVGQRVAAAPILGGCSQYTCLHEEELVPVPDGINPLQACAIILNYSTAYHLLYRVAKIQMGDQILIHGASGGVGTALVQLGNAAGLQMYGTASTSNHDYLKSYGVTPIDYRNEDFVEKMTALAPQGVDFVFDPIGGDHWFRSYKVLQPNGTFIGYGLSSLEEPSHNKINPMEEWYRIINTNKTVSNHNANIYSFSFFKKQNLILFKQDLLSLFTMFLEGDIKPSISKSFPLEDIALAHQWIQSNSSAGKVLLICHDSNTEVNGCTAL